MTNNYYLYMSVPYYLLSVDTIDKLLLKLYYKGLTDNKIIPLLNKLRFYYFIE